MKNLIAIFFFIILGYIPNQIIADEYRPAYLEFKQVSDNVFDMLWKVPARGQNARLSISVVLPDDVKILIAKKSKFIGQAHFERSTISRKGGLAGTIISIKGLEQVRTDVLVRIQTLDGSSETARLNAASTSFIVKGTPEFWNVVTTYMTFGIEHILKGFDHLLFVACLIFIAGTWRRILITITGFTLAHSLTLTLAALELVRLPIPPIEAVIALSIVFLAREIAMKQRDTITWRYPIIISSSFGLLHGFGFASALSDIGLPQTEIPGALLAFNIGVEIGQVLFVSSLLALSWLIVRMSQRLNTNSIDLLHIYKTPLAYGIGSITTFWTIERVANFWI